MFDIFKEQQVKEDGKG